MTILQTTLGRHDMFVSKSRSTENDGIIWLKIVKDAKNILEIRLKTINT